VGDVNDDGLEDLFIGGAFRKLAALFVQDKSGNFHETNTSLWFGDRAYEDVGSCMFDADNDGDQDLYVVSGGCEVDSANALLRDRLYLNDGFGNFVEGSDKLPESTRSGSVVVPADFDRDGDIDLFVGGRLVPGYYALPASSRLLVNQNGSFEDKTHVLAPELLNIGLVTDAIWIDHDNDEDLDLVLAGEWMPITVFENHGGLFQKITEPNGLNEHSGWWYCLAHGDFDRDGDEDLVAGNLGWNTKYRASPDQPFEIYMDDFDLNGSWDPVLVYSQEGRRFPIEGRNKLFLQLPYLERVFPSYESYAVAEFESLFSPKLLSEAHNLKSTMFSTAYFENQGDGTFRIDVLPAVAQLSCTQSILIDDYDRDGHMDFLLSGNNYGTEVESVRMDAGVGLLMVGNGTGKFKPLPPLRSGFVAKGDVRDMTSINIAGQEVVLVSQNSGALMLYRY
jgi:hypothetical protein